MQLACRDRNRLALEADIVGAALHGIENICCLTGDDVTAGDEPEARRVFDLDGVQLVSPRRARSPAAATSPAGRSSPRRTCSSARSRTPARRRTTTASSRALKKARAGARFLQLQVCFEPRAPRRASWRRRSAPGSRPRRRVIPSICLVRSASALRFIDEHVPGIAVPPRRSSACERAADQDAGLLRGRRRARRARPLALPGVAGLHLISFRRDAGIARLCQRLGIPPATKGRRVDTVLRSRSRTVVIGPEQPFCVIGERINPTGRKAFQAQLQAGDLSQLEIDVAGAGRGRRRRARRERRRPARRRGRPDGPGDPARPGPDRPAALHRLVDDRGARGRALARTRARRSSTRSPGEDERLEAILPIVARHGAAVIGLANDDEIPMEPRARLAIAKKIVSAAGDHGIPPEDVVIDPLAMPIGAEPRAVTLFVETLRLLRDELGVNTTCGASNTSFGLPGRHALGAAFLADRAEPRPDERDHGRALAAVRRGGARDRPPARARRVGRALDRALPRKQAGGCGGRREHCRARSAEERRTRTASGCGSSRPDGRRKEARVPAGTTLFDAGELERRRDRLDLRRPRHLQEVQGAGRRRARCRSRRSTRARSRRRAEGRLAARVPGGGAARTWSSRCRRCRRGRRRRSPASGGT